MDKSFDRTNIGLRERPVSSDFNRMQSQLYRTITETMQALFASNGSAVSGFLGVSLQVQAEGSPSLNVQVASGMGFLSNPSDLPTDIGSTDLESVDDLSPYKPVILEAPATFAVPANSSGMTRVDIVEVADSQIYRQLVDSTPRFQLDVPTKTFLPHSFYKTLTFALDGFLGSVTSPDASTAPLSYKQGVPGSGAPSTTSGYTKLAEITVVNGASSIASSAIADKRVVLAPPGTYIGRRVYDSGSGTYTPTPGTTRVVMKMVGGGGGAGNSTAAGGGNAAASGGGGSGRYIEVACGTGQYNGSTTQTRGLVTGGAYTIGTGGTGGAAGSLANGVDGGDTTIVVNGYTWTAKGGKGSVGCAASAPPTWVSGGDTQSGSDEFTNVAAGISLGSGGEPGSPGIGIDAAAAEIPGKGGSNPLGTGGIGKFGAAGEQAGGYGGGGGGSANSTGSTTSHSGGAGTGGIVIIDEWL